MSFGTRSNASTGVRHRTEQNILVPGVSDQTLERIAVDPSASSTSQISGISSPPWHRRLRAKRRAARVAIWSARAAQRQPPRSALLLLTGHHSAPRYRELFPRGQKSRHMGRKWQKQQWGQNGQQGTRGYQERQAPWQLWSGSWSSASPSSHSKSHKVRYDQISVEQPRTQHTAPVEDPLATEGAHVRQAIQRNLTFAKKADGKLRKLQEERVRRVAQWEAYEKQAMKEYMENKRQFEKDLERITHETQVASNTGKEAAAMVQQIVNHGVPEAPTEDNTAWNRLVEAADAEMADASEGFLQDALRAARATAPAPLDARLPGEGHMMSREAAARLLAATMVGLPVEQMMRMTRQTEAPPGIPAPYVVSPSGRRAEPPITHQRDAAPAFSNSVQDEPDEVHLMNTGEATASAAERRTSPLHPGQRDPALARVFTNAEPPRDDIKTATKQKPEPTVSHSKLTDKLEAARYAALRPFGGVGIQPDGSNTRPPGPAERTHPMRSHPKRWQCTQYHTTWTGSVGGGH